MAFGKCPRLTVQWLIRHLLLFEDRARRELINEKMLLVMKREAESVLGYYFIYNLF